MHDILGKKVAEEIDKLEDNKRGGIKRKLQDDESSDDDSSDSDYDVEDTVAPGAKAGAKESKKDGFEVVAQDPGNLQS